ncbi:MAG: hypothetical protein H7Z74_17215 [Anaerolineae bacterium]|nr:hypothetical protein [Gemmatimonadaceae bacterium]
MRQSLFASRRFANAVGFLALVSLIPGSSSSLVHAQGVNKETTERGRKMLAQIRKDLKEFYWDTTYKGLDLDARYAKADSAIRAARDNNHMLSIIAEYTHELKDSHTNFYPPSRVAKIDYGFTSAFFGDSLFITSVKKDSDAEKKGLKRGDVVLQFEAFKPERKTFGTVKYVYGALSPRERLRLQVRSPDSAQRQIDVEAKITMGERIIDFDDPIQRTRLIDEYDAAVRRPDHYYTSLGDSVFIWRMPSFAVGTDGVDEVMKQAKKHRSIVLDLRNNGGGLVSTMLHLVGHFFDRDVFVYDLKTRQKSEPMIAKPRGKEPFRGMLVILVNSNSASASEITSRIMQLEGRAIIVGDRSAGLVTTAYTLGREVGFTQVLSYTVQVSISDVVMSDGQRLENIGVIPDHFVLPTGADMAARRDPAMAKALSLVGVTTSPEQAGSFLRPQPKKGDDR